MDVEKFDKRLEATRRLVETGMKMHVRTVTTSSTLPS